MVRGEHDRPDPSLIVEGTRRTNPSKRIQGDDYPITPLEELELRERSNLKGMYSPKSRYSKIHPKSQQLVAIRGPVTWVETYQKVQIGIQMKILTRWTYLNQ